MTTVFLSYSTKDHHFAELAVEKLKVHGIDLWRDANQIRAGSNWREEIDHAISNSFAVLVALSKDSAESPYVTYEWAYAYGKAKPIIRIRLGDCHIHPKIQVVQYLDFSIPGSLPWESLVDRILEVEPGNEVNQESEEMQKAPPLLSSEAKAVLAYLGQRGYQMASFDRLRRRIDETMTDDDFKRMIRENRRVFRKAKLKGGKPGLAKLIP